MIPSACRASSGNGTVCSTGTSLPSATGHVSRRNNRLGTFKDELEEK